MYHFIVNPNSRSGQGAVVWEEVERELKRRGVPYSCHMTEYVGHAEKIAASISASGTPEDPVRIIVLGGDGTIHEILTGIRDLNSVIFGFIPTGSGNDFCRGMHIPNKPLEGLDVILSSGVVRTMDVPWVVLSGKKHRFGISTGIGYDAAVCQEILVSPLKKILNRFHLGKLTYALIALKQMLFITPSAAEIIMDGNRRYRFGRMYFAAVMLQQYEGGGFRFCPEASADDGVLDVIAVEGMSRLRMLLAFPTAFWAGHTNIRGIHIFRCRRILIKSASQAAVHIDGESGGVHKSLRAGVSGEKIRIILPA